MEVTDTHTPLITPFTDVGPSSSSPSLSRDQDEEELHPPEVVLHRQHSSMSYRVRHSNRRLPLAGPDGHPADDTLSCVIVILTFWFFVSMTLIMGIFGSEHLQVGPYSSILLQPNPLFVNSLKVEASKPMTIAPVLYGMYKVPSLDTGKTWSESVMVSVKPESHKEFIYYLNKGSQINISYNVASSSSVLLIVAKGLEGLAEWLEDPSYPDSTMLWNIIHGNGYIRQDISKSYEYYVAIGNLNSEDVEVELNFSIRSTLHDTTDSYYKCDLSEDACSLNIPFLGGNAALLATPGPSEGSGNNRENVKLSYEPRWITYFLGIGGMTSIMLWVFNILNRIRHNMEDASGIQSGDFRTGRVPLLSQKDDDLSSLGSSYDSASQNDEENQEDMEEECRRLCVICFDAPKDCFFIPCGHCASCFACGVRIAEAAGTCPICRRKMKKVRRIYTV